MSKRQRISKLDIERDSSDWIMPGVLLLVGLPLMLIALYMAGEEMLFRRSAQRIPGVVTEISSGTPILTVEYALPGGANQRIESFGSDLYDDVKVGDTVGVFVKTAHPEKGRLAYFTETWMLPLILGVFGSFFGIPGLFLLRSQLRGSAPVRGKQERRRAQRTPGNAQTVQAKVLEIRPLLTMSGFRKRDAAQGNIECSLSRDGDKWRLLVNGEEQDPFAAHASRQWGITYRVIAQWQDSRTGQTRTCESEEIDSDPSFYLQFGTVSVLVDRDDPDNASVDMGFLPEQ